MEQYLWVGSPSQIVNLKPFSISASVVLLLLFSKNIFAWGDICLIAISAFMVWKWIEVRSTKYHFTTECFILHSGVFNIKETFYPYNLVTDVTIDRSLLLRSLSLCNVNIFFGGLSVKKLTLLAIPLAQRALITQCIREQKSFVVRRI